MASRSPLTLLSAILFLAPGSVFAQAVASAPPEVDQALRANVNAFFQDFVDGKFRAALDLVAQDTQDYYFSQPKAEIKKFKINSIEYSDNFSKAAVRVNVTTIQHWRAEGFSQDVDVDQAWDTAWKTENGKWVYHDQPKTSGWVTPMGPSADLAPAGAAAAAARSQDRKINDTTMLAEAQRILGESGKSGGLSPDTVTLALDKPSSAKVVFHNSSAGSVSLSLLGLPADLPGFTAKVGKQTLNAGQDTDIDLSFDPSAGAAKSTLFTIHVIVQPFQVEFPLKVNLGSAQN
jgi:hypothetical protein